MERLRSLALAFQYVEARALQVALLRLFDGFEQSREQKHRESLPAPFGRVVSHRLVRGSGLANENEMPEPDSPPPARSFQRHLRRAVNTHMRPPRTAMFLRKCSSC